MTNKERLEKIRNNAVFLTNNEGDFIDVIKLRVDDYAYLYERVEELEKKQRVDSELFEKQVEINQRYKQALERIIKYGESSEIIAKPSQVTKIAHKALEESE